MKEVLRLPFYAKLSLTLLSLAIIFTAIYLAQGALVPLLLALLFAILLEPVSKFLNRKLKFPHVIAVLFTIFLFLAFFAGLLLFLSWQIGDIVNDWATIKKNMYFHIDNLQTMVYENFNINKVEQKKMVDDATEGSTKMVGTTLISITDALFNAVLVPILTFLIILYKNHFIKFLCKLFDDEVKPKLRDILSNIKTSVQSYIVGLFIQMVTVSTLTSIGYYIIGLKYALLLGVITGLLNLIPYIGIMMAALLSMAATLTATPDVTIIFGVIAVNVVVQFIDNNLLVPLIVSSKVEINALVSIIGIIIGGSLAGFAGMFLAIPLLAIMKVVFTRVDELEPWGYLMGDDLPKKFKWKQMQFSSFEGYNSESETTDPLAPKVIYSEKPSSEEVIKNENE